MAYIEIVIKLYGEPTFSVSADNTIKMELKGSRAGGSVVLYSNDLNVMYYCIRYAKKRVNIFTCGNVVLKAWVTNDGRARAKLQGNLERVKRERSRVGADDLPSLTEEATDGSDVTALTEYCVLRHLAANWGTNQVAAYQGRTLDAFVVRLMELHNSLVASNVIENEPILTGSVLPTDPIDENTDENEAERLRSQMLRQQDASRVQVVPLPPAFLLVNANATVHR